MNILYVTSEVYPLVKTGGLADVSGSLPRALLSMKQDVRILLPAYRSVMDQVKGAKVVATTRHYDCDVNILQTRLPGTRVKVLLVDCAVAFDRPGNPYLAENGEQWLDNAFRFALFCQVAVDVALNRLAFDWSVDVVNCNDWQTGLVPALLQHFDQRPATVFTIHNLAYQGLFSQQAFIELGLPQDLWTLHGVEFNGLFSFIKGGLSYADYINAVSPQYAHEIQMAEFGYGLEGLLEYRAQHLSGILNGIDTTVWNPGTDEYIEYHYNRRSLNKKLDNKLDLQQRYGLKKNKDIMLVGMISRMVEQKGFQLIIEAMPELSRLPLQMVFLGNGEKQYENALTDIASKHPQSVATIIGYDEQLSHQIEAASDVFLMPSLFEPCGLNQLYSLRYGTLPLVTPVGGLVDSVIDYDEESYARKQANGFVMPEVSTAALVNTLHKAFQLYQQKQRWKQLQLTAMAEDHSWGQSAEQYLKLYQQAIEFNAFPTGGS